MSKPTTTTAIARVPTEKLAELAERCGTLVAAAKGQIAETFALAQCVQELRTAVLPLVPQIRPLVGTSLGFRTDRDNSDKYPPYADAVIADVLVEAVARGLRWTGNEINVLGSKLYVTKEGYARLLAELPGLTDLELSPGVPSMKDGGAVVRYRATWKIDGKPYSLERDIPTRLNAGMGADAAVGKATRKMLAAIHARITGSVQSFADSDAEDVEMMRESKVAGLVGRLVETRTTESLPAAAPEKIPAAVGFDGEGLFGNKADAKLPD